MQTCQVEQACARTRKHTAEQHHIPTVARRSTRAQTHARTSSYRLRHSVTHMVAECSFAGNGCQTCNCASRVWPKCASRDRFTLCGTGSPNGSAAVQLIGRCQWPAATTTPPCGNAHGFMAWRFRVNVSMTGLMLRMHN